MTENIEQRSPEWFAARCGSLGASQIADAVATLKDNKTPAATSANLVAKMVIERLTGVQEDRFKSGPMQWGIDNEEGARRAYEWDTGDFVIEAGLYKHPTITGSHASPDGLVDDDGLIEIKCPNSATHITTLKTGTVATQYVYQMQWQMACTGRQWCDFVSFDPRFPENLQLFVKRFKRDDNLLSELEDKVLAFLTRVDADLEALNKIGALYESE
jgi:putative phage-type endonuclease